MDYYSEIKRELIDNEITQRVKYYSKNKSDLIARYNAGKLLFEAGKRYGENIIKSYSEKLKIDVNSKYNETTLKRMRQFYILIQKGAPLVHQLSWSNYVELIPIENIDAVKYYIQICVKELLSKRELRTRIKNKEYERLDKSTKLKLINEDKNSINDFIKNPILINNKNNYEFITEKVLQKLILEDIENFMKELGNSFSFIASEYKIKIGNNYNYIDLLLFNYEYNTFVVIELKITELKKEHIGQIHVYMNYIDENLRKPFQDKTIGIIICKKNNEFLIKYCSDPRIIGKEYEIIN